MLWFKFARRYMFSPKSHSVINIIAMVSLIAVAVPTAAMVILLSMFGGLGEVIERLYSSVDADIEIIAAHGEIFDEEAVSLDELRSVAGIAEVAPYIEQQVMAASSGRRTTFTLRGIDSCYTAVMPLAAVVERGTVEQVTEEDIVLGYGIAAELGAYGLGSEIELYALNRKQISTLLPMGGISRKKVYLSGIVNANAEIDAELALTEIESLQRLLNHPHRLSGIAVKLRENADIAAVEQEVDRLGGGEVEARTREEKNASLNKILRMERFAIIVIGALIALVATFAIVGSVVMLITEKRRDIATLRAMGASQSLLQRIFTGEGVLLCAIGCINGLVLGIGFCLGQMHYGWIRIPGNSIIESYPVALDMGDIAIVAIVVMLAGGVISHFTVRHVLR